MSIGPAIKRHAARLRRIAVLRHDGGGDQRGDAGLADGHHVRARPHHLEEFDQVVDVVVEAERPVRRPATSRTLCQSVMKTSCSGSIVRTVERSSVAKWPDSGAINSTRGCACSMSFLK